MSTKIYNGYKIKNLSTFEFNEFLNILRARLTDAYLEKYAKLFCSVSTSMIDDLMFKNKYEPEKLDEYLIKIHKERYYSLGHDLLNPKEDTLDEIKKHLNDDYFGSIKELTENFIQRRCHTIAVTERRNEPFDFISNLVVYNLNSEFVLFQVFGTELQNIVYDLVHSRKKSDKNIVKMYQLEEYEYYNNCDKPYNVSKKKWEQRRDDWDTVLPGIGIPSVNGITIELISSSLFLEGYAYKLYGNKSYFKFSTVEERAKKYAKQECQVAYLEKNIPENEKPSYTNSISLLMDFDKKIKEKDKEILESIDKKTEEFKNLFIPLSLDIVFESLLSFIQNKDK